MVLGKREKSFILLAATALIIVWFLFSIFSRVFFAAFAKNSDIFHSFISQDYSDKWFNVSRSLTKKDLKGRIVLLDFWTYSCIKCIQSIPDIKALEAKYGERILVIGVHSGKFDNEKNPQSIREAIIKYDITHPVVNDADLEIWDEFGIKAWPSLILVSPNGKVEDVFEGGGHQKKLSNKIDKLVKKYRFFVNAESIPIVLERDLASDNVLNFPSKIEYAKNFDNRNGRKISALVISNSSDNNVIVSTVDGEILEKIGSGIAGFDDGNFSDATFNYPVGLLYTNGILYVADRGNHAIRKVDFKKRKISTVVGLSGVRGDVVSQKVKADKALLSSPQDLEYFPDKNNIVIANLGTNQLLKYDIKKNTVTPLAGDGKREVDDGKYPNNSLAQPSGLSVFKDKLYFVDSYSSSLRSLDKDGVVETLIGGGVDQFGSEDGNKSEALMQNPLGVFASKDGVFVADSQNHLVRKYSNSSKKMSTYSGNGHKASDIGKITSYNEVSDIIGISNKLYMVDSGNNRIVIKKISTGKTSVLDIIPRLVLPQDGLLEYLPDLETLPNQNVKSGVNINLLIKLKEGWKVNEMAPSFFNLVEISGKSQANLIASYDWNMVKGGVIKLPKMSSKRGYYLQGTVYYCEDKEDALCFIHSYQSKIFPSKSSKLEEIKISL